jgi:prophage regulatory protein
MNRTLPQTNQSDRILRVQRVAERLGVSTPTVWRWSRAGILPAPIHVGPRVTGWSAEAIDRFVAKRAEAA